MLTGNKGEWSEVYAFVKLIATGVIDLCDENFVPLRGQQLPVQKIFRENVTFDVTDDHFITLTFEDNKTLQITRATLDKDIDTLFNEITAGEGAFECIAGEKLLNDFRQSQLKAEYDQEETPQKQKKDLEFEILDPKVLTARKVGFSIKSQLGGKSTLFNSDGDNTNFCFELVGGNFDPKKINAIEGQSKIMKRVAALIDAGCDFKFSCCKGSNLRENLKKIDSQMPEILGWAVLGSFAAPKGKKKITDVLQSSFFREKILNISIPLDPPSIQYKFKHFLGAMALGMFPATPWSGQIDADGGFIVVKRNGDLVCFHVYNLANFQKFLLGYTTFDTPSTKRHKMGQVYTTEENDGRFFFDVNCLIRFIEPKTKNLP